MPQSRRNAVQPLAQSAFGAAIRRSSSNAKSVFAIWADAQHPAGHAPLPASLPALPASLPAAESRANVAEFSAAEETEPARCRHAAAAAAAGVIAAAAHAAEVIAAAEAATSADKEGEFQAIGVANAEGKNRAAQAAAEASSHHNSGAAIGRPAETAKAGACDGAPKKDEAQEGAREDGHAEHSGQPVRLFSCQARRGLNRQA